MKCECECVLYSVFSADAIQAIKGKELRGGDDGYFNSGCWCMENMNGFTT